MSDHAAGPTTLRLILLPTILTLGITIARVVGELQGWVDTISGGIGVLLGISWLIPVVGAWFGWRLAKAGHLPRVQRAFWPMLLFALAIVGTAAWRFAPLDPKGTTEADLAALRLGVQWLAAVTSGAAVLTFLVWGRLAWTLLCYGLIARATVVGITWLAKTENWDTHYTKLGPAGIERPLADTMAATTLAQFGVWTSLTVVGGTLIGSLFARRSSGHP